MTREKELITQQINDVKKHASEGRILFITPFGAYSKPVESFIEQPADGILYYLNRNELTTLAFASSEDLRWVNDYAVATTIRALKKRISELENKQHEDRQSNQ